MSEATVQQLAPDPIYALENISADKTMKILAELLRSQGKYEQAEETDEQEKS